MEKYTQTGFGRALVRTAVLSLRGLIVFALGIVLVVLRASQRSWSQTS